MCTKLDDLIKLGLENLSNDHLAWDEWAAKWQENSRSVPDRETTYLIWAMTVGYRVAVDKCHGKYDTYRRAQFREQISNLAVLFHLTRQQENDLREVIESCDLITRQVREYFSLK